MSKALVNVIRLIPNKILILSESHVLVLDTVEHGIMYHLRSAGAGCGYHNFVKCTSVIQ
jgi:hypothetical protein